MTDTPFRFGPGYVGDRHCCGRPVGCSVTDPRCLHLNHRWKRENVAALGGTVTHHACGQSFTGAPAKCERWQREHVCPVADGER